MKENKKKLSIFAKMKTWQKVLAAASCVALVGVVAVAIFNSAPISTKLGLQQNLTQSAQVNHENKASKYSQESYDALKDVINVEYKGKKIKLAKLDPNAYVGFIFKPDPSVAGFDALRSKLKAACKKGLISALSGGAYASESLDTIASLVKSEQLEYIDPDYVVTLADTSEGAAGNNTNAEAATGNNASTSALTNEDWLAFSKGANKAAASNGNATSSNTKSSATAKTSAKSGGTSQNPAPDWPPTDAYYTSGDLWNLDMLEIEGAWKLGLDGDSYIYNKKPLHDGDVKVAVIDSGLYGTGASDTDKHEDINYDKVIVGKNCVTSSSTTSTSSTSSTETSATETGTPDTLGHGTFVSGLIAAKVNNSVGVAGAMPGVTIVTEKVFEGRSGKTSDIINAIYDAVDNQKVDVINMSLGGEGNETALKTACEHAAENGILVVASAGNDGNSTANYPAAYDCVVGVASVDKNKERSSFSQYGKSVFVTAPGEDVTSTYCESSTSYKTASGTSFSGPEVASLAAMCKSIFPEIDQDTFMDLLIDTSTDLGTKGYDDYYGYGLVNFSKMAQVLLESQAMPWYNISFEIKDQAGKTLTPDSIVVSAAEDISWEENAQAGIDEAGTWRQGTVIEPDANGKYVLHKGNYNYSVVLDGKYSIQSTFKTYAENQTVTAVMDDAQEITITPSYSNGTTSTAASLTITSSDGRVETPKSTSNGSYIFDLRSGTYSFAVSEDGYVTAKGSFVVQRADLTLKPVLYKSNELCSVNFSCVNDDDGTEITTGVNISVYNASEMSISPDISGSFSLAKGESYKAIISKLGYEDKIINFSVDNATSQNIEARLVKAECTITFSAIDEDGNVIDGASIEVKNESGNVMQPSAYNSLRFYLKQGNYSYKLSAEGYAQASGSFGVSLESRTLKITLKAVPNKLSFNIEDEDGQAISDASVKVTTSATMTTISASADGTYQLVRGSYRYVIYKAGYASARGSFEIGSQDKVIDIVLKKAQAVEGEYEGGSGTAQDPYQIATEKQLRYLAQQTTIERVAKSDAPTNKKAEITGYYELVNDIELTSAWTPIGNYENSANYVAFSGYFDGAGHSVSGINVEGVENGTLIDAQGFFGYVKGATILNLTVEGTVCGDEYVGGLVGQAYYSYSEQYSDWNTGTTLIKGCKSEVVVHGRYGVGGIVGSCYASLDSSDIGIPTTELGIRVTECLNRGDIFASKNGEYGKNASAAGGICGSVQRSKIDNCYSSGKIKAGYNAGGIAGNINSAKIANSYFSGTVNIYAEGTGYSDRCGSIAGRAYNTAISDSYALNNEKSTDSKAVGATYNTELNSVEVLEHKDMYCNENFITKLNTDTVNSQVGTSFIAGNDYPALSWEHAQDALLAKRPHINTQPCGNSEDDAYKVSDEIPALSAQVDALDDGGNLTWQWFGYKNDSGLAEEKIDGASGTGTSASFTPSIDEPGLYYYRVVFTNTLERGTSQNAASVSSEYACVYVRSAVDALSPQITALNPNQTSDFNTNLSAKETSDLELSVQAQSEDGGTLSYQWFKSSSGTGNGVEISGATSNSYDVDTSSACTMYYCVKVTNKTEPGNSASVLSDWIKVEVKPYTIETYEELVSFRTAVNSGQSFSGHTVTLKADITIPDGVKWEPIGTSENPFSGTFMGGVGYANSKTIVTHTISNLYVDGDAGGNYYQGFFGYIYNGNVYDLNISGKVSGTNNIYAGLVVGLADASSGTCEIANCSTLTGSSVEGKYYVGGICGWGNANIADSANHANIYGRAFEPNSSESSSGESYNKYVWGIGGVVGCSSAGYIRGCYNSGDVSIDAISATQKCAIYAGGVLGYSSTYSEIESCFNAGQLSVGTKASKSIENGVLYAGAVAGYVSYEQYLNLHYLENTYSCGVNVSSGTDYSEYHSLAFMKSNYFVTLLNDGTYANQFVKSQYGAARLSWETDTSTDDGIIAPAEAYIDDIELADADDITSTWQTYYYKDEKPSPIHVYAYAVDDGRVSYRWQSRESGADDSAWTDVADSGGELSPDADGKVDATYTFDTSAIGTLEYRCVLRNTLDGATVSPNYIEVETPSITIEIRDNAGVFSLKDPTQENSIGNPWVLSSAQQLKMFADVVNGDAKLVGISDETFSNQYVSLEADIDLSELDAEFSPIGNYSKGKYFAGCFMGNNHTINNLSIKRSASSEVATCEYQGLFAYLAGAFVMDLEVCGSVDIANTNAFATGGVVGYAYETILLNVSNYVDVTGYNRVGGVAAYTVHCIISDCENQGSVTTIGDQGESGLQAYDVGGVVGSLVLGTPDDRVGLFNSYNAGQVTGCLSSGNMRMGALAGSRTSQAAPKISNCFYLKGSAKCTDSTDYEASGCGQNMSYPEEDEDGIITCIDNANSPQTAWTLNSSNSTDVNSGFWGIYEAVAGQGTSDQTAAIHLVHANKDKATYRVDTTDVAANIKVSNEYPVCGEQIEVKYSEKSGFIVNSLKYKSIGTGYEDQGQEIVSGESFEMPAYDVCFESEYEQDLTRDYSIDVKAMLYGGASVESGAVEAQIQDSAETNISTSKAGKDVIVKLKVADKYQIKTVAAEDEYSVPVSIQRKDGLTYEFTMPAANTIVKVVLEAAGSEASKFAASLDVTNEAVHKKSSDSTYKTGTYLQKTVLLSGSEFGPSSTTYLSNNIKTLEEIESYTRPSLYEQEYSFADGSMHRYTGFNMKLLLESMGLSSSTPANTQVIFESADGSTYKCTWKDICSLAYNCYDSTAQPITRGLPVLLSTGVDGAPNKEGLNVIFGQTSATDDNASKIIKDLTRIVVGDDINYSQHVWSPYNDIDNLGGSTSVKIKVYSGNDLLGTKTYSIKDIEKWANANKAGVQRGTFATAIYENTDAVDDYSGPYADYYEGFDLSKVFEKAGITKVSADALHNTKVQFFQNSGYSDSWKTVNVSMDYILGNGSDGYGDYSDYFTYASDSTQTSQYKQSGVRPMIAYGKNAYPLVLYSGSKGMVSTAYNYRGPLMAILPQNVAEGGGYVADKTCAACYLSDIEIYLPQGTEFDPTWGEDGGTDDDGGDGDDGKKDDGSDTSPDKDTRLDAGKSFAYGTACYVVQSGKKTVYIKANSKKIKKLAIPATVKDSNGNSYEVTGIAAKGFKNCKKLTKVSGGKSITTICAKAFSGCKKLKKATFKSKVLKKIGKKAFYKTTKLTKITIKKTTKLKTVKGAFKKAGKNSGKKLVIKVKSSKKKTYKKLILKKGGNKKLRIK